MDVDLAFEGGGAKGLAFVGALQAIERHGHKARRVVGTSAGSIVAILVAAGYSAAECKAAINERLPDGSSRFGSFLQTPRIDESVELSTSLRGWLRTELDNPLIPNVIDEIPALAVFGTRLHKGLRIRDAAELRKKESDRIRAIVDNLSNLGIRVEESPDGLFVPGDQSVQGGRVRTFGDHRIAMAFAVAGLISEKPVELDDPGCAGVSFPDFYAQLELVAR